VQANEVEFLSYTNAEIDEVEALPAHWGFHVVRDPRDVLVSAYFYHRDCRPSDDQPELVRHHEKLQSLPKEEGLLEEIKFSHRYLDKVEGWDYDNKRIMELKMENLTMNPNNTFKKILKHLRLWGGKDSKTASRVNQRLNRIVYAISNRLPINNLPKRFIKESYINSEIMENIIDDHKFEKMTGGRKRGKEDKGSHYRKGVPKDWINHFTEKIERGFKKEYGCIIEKAGYEGF